MTKAKLTITAVLATALLFILPDFVFSVFRESFKHSCDIKVLLLILPLSIGLVFNKYKWLSILFISLLCLLQLIQFFHISYFGMQMTHYAIFAGINEFKEVVSESTTVFLKYFYVIPIVFLPFIVMLFCLKIKCYKSIIGTVILCLTFSYIGYNRINLHRFLPNEIRFTIDNSIKSFFGYCYLICHKGKIKNYLPYEVKNISDSFDEPITIVYIIGESVNFKHMSLFGYDKDTTPNLRKLSKEKSFYYTTGISSGTGTLSSCKFMMNVIYEPDNVYQTSSNLTNLFRLAKQKNFKTFYVSSQRDNVLTSIAGVNYIDTIITNGASIMNVAKITDEMLPDIVSNNKLEKRNFIVLHQRCMHSPYSSNKFASPNYKEYKKYINEASKCFSDTDKASQKKQLINDYDNAMLYNDYLISKMFNRFNKQGAGKFYVIWASDHNELLGEDGLYGHAILSRYTADIPIMIQSNDIEFMKIMKAIFKPTHYEIAKNIAKILGYEIINPNEEENVFYIDGVDFTGRCGYIRFKKDVVNHRIEYFKDEKVR